MSKERDSKKRIALVQLFAERSASAELPSEIHVIPTGEWAHPVYGPMVITAADITQFKQNFDDGIRRDIPITAGHDNGMSGGELPAVGWFKEAIDRGTGGLYCTVQWTPDGEKLLTEGSFKYFSPEFYEVYEDPETHDIRKNVLVGGALTNKPYFKELEQVYAFSEPEITKSISEYMKLETILKKKFSELNDEEKSFLREHKEELNDEQKTAFKAVFDENGGEGDAGEKDDGGSDEGDGGGEGDGEGKEKVEGSEGKMRQLSEAEFQALTKAANDGAKALQKVEASERREYVGKLIMSESNKDGRFLPKQSDALEKFVKTLSESQREQFRQIVQNMPKATPSMFKELGDEGEQHANGVQDIAKQVQKLANEKMSANAKLSFSEAIKQVFMEKPELKAEYEKAMEGAQGE